MNDELTPTRAGCHFISSFFIHTSSFAFCSREQTHFGQVIADGHHSLRLSVKFHRPPKAPEGWRTPRRFARFGGHRSTRQRFGVRWPSTAFSSRTKLAYEFNRPLPRSSNPNWLWPGVAAGILPAVEPGLPARRKKPSAIHTSPNIWQRGKIRPSLSGRQGCPPSTSGRDA